MTTYSTISNNEVDVDSPLTQSLATKYRDNPIAMAERAAGAPLVVGSLQTVESLTSAVSTITTVIPLDNSIPQSSEGVELLTISITPKSATSKIRIKFDVCCGAWNWSVNAVGILFKDSNVNCLYVAGQGDTTSRVFNLHGEYSEISGSTATRTYKLRVATQNNTVYINSRNGTDNIWGGKAMSYLRVTEEIL